VALEADQSPVFPPSLIDAAADVGDVPRARWARSRITVVIANRYAFDTEVVTGKQIKEKANIPAGFALYRRMRGGDESIRNRNAHPLPSACRAARNASASVPTSCTATTSKDEGSPLCRGCC